MASTDAVPVPRKNVAYRVTFPILDADGDLVTAAAALDSELSGDAGTFADVTLEATEIATSSGMYYLELSAAEMNYDTVAIIVKTTTTGAKTTPIVMYPETLGDIRVDVGQISGDATAADNCELFYDGTGYAAANSTVGTVTTVSGFAANAITAAAIANAAIDAATFAAGAIDAAAIANSAIDAATFAAGAIDATAIAANAIGASQIATGAITAAKFAAGAIDAAAIATGAIDADALATDAANEIRDAVINRISARQNTAQAGAAGSITLDAAASATTDFYKGALIFLDGGTGAGQARLCTAYNGTTKVATVVPNWATNPDVTSTFVVLAGGEVLGVNNQDLTNLDAAITTRATPAQVNTEVVDALATDTYAESGVVVAGTATLSAMITWLKTLARNKITQTATTQTLRNDADSGNVATAAVSDDGTTATRAEWA